MPTLGGLWRAVFPTADLRGPGAATERVVGWVRLLRARVPAFDALEASDLAILPVGTLAQLARGAVEPPAIVEALVDAGAAGVVVLGGGTEPIHAGEGGEVGEELLTTAEEAGLAAFHLTHGDPAALERAAIGYLVNGRAEIERQAARLERQLERLALEGASLDAHAAAIGGFLGRAVAIESGHGRPLAVHASGAAPGAGAAAARYLRRPRRVALRTPLPETTGSLLLLGDVPVSELEEVASQRVSALLALELSREETLGSPEPRGRGGSGLPGEGPPWVALCARQSTGPASLSSEERSRVRAALRRLLPGGRLSLRGDTSSLDLRLVAAVTTADPGGMEAARRVAELLGRPLAVSRPFASPEDRPRAEAEARRTLEAAEAAGPDGTNQGSLAASKSRAGRGGEHILRAELLPAYQLLAALPHLPEGQRWARALLDPLMNGRPAAQRARLATLGAALEFADQVEAAAALGIHRNTLAYRLSRIEAVTGWHLDDPDLRLALMLAVRIVQRAQADGS